MIYYLGVTYLGQFFFFSFPYTVLLPRLNMSLQLKYIQFLSPFHHFLIARLLFLILQDEREQRISAAHFDLEKNRCLGVFHEVIDVFRILVQLHAAPSYVT